jgi:hypothetical protein
MRLMGWAIALGLAFSSTPSIAQVAYPPADTSKLVKSVNGLLPASGDVTVPLPSASTTIPPCIADNGSAGTAGTMLFAPFNHTHCSKVRRTIVTSAADGSYTWTFSPVFNNPPVCAATAEVAAGVTDVVNVQIVGTPTTTTAQFLVNRTNRSVVALIGLTILSVPTSPGATRIHLACIEP